VVANQWVIGAEEESFFSVLWRGNK
jgi:hypothetical protein